MSLREKNKVRTRTAILNAAKELAKQGGEGEKALMDAKVVLEAEILQLQAEKAEANREL